MLTSGVAAIIIHINKYFSSVTSFRAYIAKIIRIPLRIKAIALKVDIKTPVKLS
jgi:hypothetical protein